MENPDEGSKIADKFKVECDEYCIAFSDFKQEVFLDLENLPKLRHYIDNLDNYLNSKKDIDDDPLDVPMDLEDNNL